VEKHMPLIDNQARDRIRDLNDTFRKSFDASLGKVVTTAGVSEFGADIKVRIMIAVQVFSDFSEENDPHGEHDFGSFELFTKTFFWKIDYYDNELRNGSEDPSDPVQTKRVLTIMLAEEY
jgi:hypothetical protein